MDTVLQIECEIKRVLDSVTETNSPNCVAVDKVRNWIVEYLGFWDDECAKFPEVAAQSHWNLWMADYDLARDAVLVVATFDAEGMQVICGRGSSPAVRAFCEHDSPADIPQLANALAERFPIQNRTTTFARGIVEAWLGRRIQNHQP